jgi:Zn-dependent protease with chaperone function
MDFTLPSLNAKLFYCIFFFNFIAINTDAQQSNYDFAVLGSTKYVDKIKQLEKYVVPKFYTDKSSQAWYDEFLTGRNKSLLSMFKDNEIIFDTVLLEKCNAILKRISLANTNFKYDSIKLYINRDIVANAACYGEGTIVINLGLFLWVESEDELALVIAHEMAHQLLNHSDSKIKSSIATLTSAEFLKELKDIKKSGYDKYNRYNNLMKGFGIESGKHSRYKENEADSLGVVLCRNAKYNISNAAKILLKFDHVEDLFKSNKLYNLKEFFSPANIDLSSLTVKPKYNGLSSANVTMTVDKDIDSIKTHPDCKKRYETIIGKGNLPEVACCTSLNNSMAKFKEKAMVEIVRYLYENNSLSYCIHFSLFALKNNYNPAFYKNIVSACFSKIYYNDANLKRFNSVNVDAERESNIKELQDYLFAISKKDVETLAANFITKTDNINAVDYDFANTMYQTQVKQKDREIAYTTFNTKYPNNKYYYLIQKKEKQK